MRPFLRTIQDHRFFTIRQCVNIPPDFPDLSGHHTNLLPQLADVVCCRGDILADVLNSRKDAPPEPQAQRSQKKRGIDESE